MENLAFAVAEVVDAWLAPDSRCFKLRGTDGDTYLVRHDARSRSWELTRRTQWLSVPTGFAQLQHRERVGAREDGMGETSVPALLRHQVDRWAEAWLTAKFSRLLELRARDPGAFNYPIAVFSEWRGNAFYLNVRYRARSRRPEVDFVIRHTRMSLTGFGRFDLAYFRHTDKWFTVYRAPDGCRVLSGDRGDRDLLADDLTRQRVPRSEQTVGHTHNAEALRDLRPAHRDGERI